MIFKKIVDILPSPLRDFCLKHEDKLSYLFFGALTTLVSIFSQYAADYFGAPTAAATTISWVCAVTFAFFTNRAFVFKSGVKKLSGVFYEALKFYGGRVATYLAELAFMLLTVDVLLLNMHIMKIIAQVFIIVGNYFISKFFVFKKKK
jgi:putative flippase GtrA